MPTVLGIETSCDETAVAVVRDRRVLATVVASQHELHEEYGGVVPEIASRAHVERIIPVLRAALARAAVSANQIAAVAVGHRPGLIGSLLVGVSAAKALAWSLGVPLVGVDHVHAHLAAGLLAPQGEVDPPQLDGLFPALGLVVSGGHTSLYRVASPIELQRLGATIDDALGEAFDKAATILGLPHPGGPALEALASSASARADARDFPVARLGHGSLDFSFSGLKTAMLYAVRGLPEPSGAMPRRASDLSNSARADLAASFQRAAVRAVRIKLDRATDHLVAQGEAPCALLAGGGVVANRSLRAALADFAEQRRMRLIVPPMSLCVDNAAMIAGLGAELLAAGRTSALSLAPVPTTAL